MTSASIITYDRYRPTESLRRRILRHLTSGGLVVLPTETQYALTADALSPDSVDAICRVKGRSGKHPFSVFFPDRASLGQYRITVPDYAEKLASEFWPGPVTLVLPAKSRKFKHLGTRDSIGVRVTPEPLLSGLSRRFDRPLIATSANPSGADLTSTKQNRWLARMAADGILLWVRPSHYRRRAPSTVIDCTGRRPRILRVGAVAERRLQRAFEKR